MAVSQKQLMQQEIEQLKFFNDVLRSRVNDLEQMVSDLREEKKMLSSDMERERRFFTEQLDKSLDFARQLRGGAVLEHLVETEEMEKEKQEAEQDFLEKNEQLWREIEAFHNSPMITFVERKPEAKKESHAG